MSAPPAGSPQDIEDLIRQDEQARVRALDPSQSIILDAPAGSGKTTVLTQRLLRLLCEVDEPEEIIAITFTRKAAGEMAERVFNALRGGAEQDDSAPGRVTRELARAVQARSRERGWALTDSPQRLRIQTIDSLNRWLAGQLPLGANGAGELAVLEDPGTAYAMAARRTLVDAQGMASLRPDAELLFERLENDFGRCEALLADMLKARAHWLPHLVRAQAGDGTYLPSRVQDALRSMIDASLAQARQRVPASLWREGLDIGAAAAANRRAAGHEPGPWCVLESGAPAAADELATQLAQWQALAQMALTQAGEWRKRLDVRSGFPANDKTLKQRALQWVDDMAAVPGCEALLAELLLLPAPMLAPGEAEALCALARVLNLAAAELDVVFRELGRVDYAFIAASAREALGEEGAPTDLGLVLDARIRHILVDEFQDTSIEQTALLASLTEGWQPGDGRTLFVVGDPMQSIYRFREAEVGLFLEARTHGIGQVRLTPLSLRRNFRSVPALVRWCNEVFGRCFPAADDPRASAVRHVASVAGRADGMAGQVQLHHTLPGDAAGEAGRIADLVQQLRARRPQGSIAVLVTARAHARPIVQALTARGIEVAGVDLVPLGEVPVVRDLAALTRALDHLADRTAWLAVLRAPWCGLSLVELTRLAGDSGVTLWESMSATAAPLAGEAAIRLQRVHAALAPLVALRGQWPLARLVESAWLRLNGPAACAGEQELLQARVFLDALAGWTQQPDWNGPQDLAARLARLYARHEERDTAVQIMTIHRAKGLEFDAVILPGLGRRMRAEREPLLRWLDLPRSGGSDLLMAPVPPLAATEPSPLNACIKSLQALRLAHERVRLLYVAATRARVELHLFAALDPERAVPAAGAPLASLWPALAVPLRELLAHSAQRAGVTEVPEPAVAQPPLQRLALDFQPPAVEPAPPVVGLAFAPWEPPGQALSADAEREPARLQERAVRDVLRRQARKGRLVTDVEEALPALRERLQQLQCPAEHMDEAVAAAAELLSRCLTDERLHWLCSSGRSQVESPLALTGLQEGRLVSVRADLAFVAEGTRWLVDFALAVDGVAPTPEGQIEAHRTRLQRYQVLAAQLDGLPARAAVYVPALAVFAAL